MAMEDGESKSDRISNLPEFIRHQIISYLPTEEAARTSALSKTWLQSYSTSPFIRFNERFFLNSPEQRYPFFSFVRNTLLRYDNLNLRVYKLELIFCVDHAPTYHLLDESLGLAFSNGLKDLFISTFSMAMDHEVPTYTLPLTIFESPKMLTSLKIHQCMFPQNVVSISKCSATIFPFLKRLKLSDAYIDDGMLQKLLSSSSSLEEVFFCQVSGFKTFQVSNLSKLKVINIHIESVSETIAFDIEDAPSLCLVEYFGSYESPSLLKVNSAPNLRRLEFSFVSIGENSLNELVKKSSLLEDLYIYDCYGFERINIVSGSLKHLGLIGCDEKLVEVKVDAPSLLTLHFNGENMISLSLNNTPEGLETNIFIFNDGLDQLNNEWFHQLKKLLRGVTNLVKFGVFHENQGIDIGTVHDMRANPLPMEHQSESYMHKIDQSSSTFVAFVETLFSSSRPTMIYNFDELTPFFADLIKFLVCDLIRATTDSNCCSSDQTKCWRHYLKDIKVEVYENSEKEWQPLPLPTSLSEFKFCGKKIRCRLKWYANLNSQV